jgi:hypothetical protein
VAMQLCLRYFLVIHTVIFSHVCCQQVYGIFDRVTM